MEKPIEIFSRFNWFFYFRNDEWIRIITCSVILWCRNEHIWKTLSWYKVYVPYFNIKNEEISTFFLLSVVQKRCLQRAIPFRGNVILTSICLRTIDRVSQEIFGGNRISTLHLVSGNLVFHWFEEFPLQYDLSVSGIKKASTRCPL